ncbi:aminotransferase class III-fold pyridoxal phosphate-dependent enzyme [Xinfangfangia sp. CPCC 101601]|uniref:Aminotransferase class III-fold pyridoxal phosphate-dependent enzyme n=1 Tax=Pseudogemmobacter lacusdianii TaxID=3069608 RepID=A0ABU0W1F7_9RHOB|nr:aminotransferase class III-fold pyridoxal phosphate-dependent enzyme [Xinfangfangia sp. CPCC 101601]MDQ2067806.1 aminotransferase class III-fold pyridoxal phosphate-dependent enzyme [Xinfangfangia sp. CPCC 101601]
MSDLYARDSAAIAGLQKLRFFPQAVVGGKGATLEADDGRSLIDLSGAWGAASLGYGHPALVAAVTAAIANPAGASVLSSANGPALALAERLLKVFPSDQPQKVWLGHSGSDANEAAIRAARRATGRSGIIGFAGAYHGCTIGTMAVSGHPTLASDKAADLIQLPYPGASAEGPDADSILELLMQRLREVGPETIAACIFEPILADGGLIVPPAGFLAKLDAICRAHGILMICDEVKVGLARTGRLNAYEHEGFRPDMLILGKGLGGGLPLSAVIGPDWVMDCATAFAMQTLHGNPVCAAAGLAVLATIDAESLSTEATRKGDLLKAGLLELASRHPSMAEVRGRGLAIGVEIKGAETPLESDATATAGLMFHAHSMGLVAYCVGPNSNVLELTPPLTITEDEIAQALKLLDAALTDLEAGRIDGKASADFAGW